nr:unnamed protein product [Callosobruchus analis]
MNQNDIEQLATFMGHTRNIHQQVYRLPDDIYQTAKISKIPMLMEKGEAAKYKGKTLEEIEINLEEELHESDASDAENLTQAEINVSQTNSGENEIHDTDTPSTSSASIKPRRTLVPCC